MDRSYRAVVVDTVHPQGLMMARVKLQGLWDDVPDDQCPWAEYLLPIGGGFVPTQKGDLVWIDFPYHGDTRRPRIVGAAQLALKGKPNVPPESWAGDGAYEPPRGDGQPPAPPMSPTEDYVYKRCGLLERRTAGGGWSVTHTPTGTEVGINDAGQVVIIGAKDVYVESATGVTIKTAAGVKMEAQEGVSIKAGAGVSIEAGGSVDINCSGVNVTC